MHYDSFSFHQNCYFFQLIYEIWFVIRCEYETVARPGAYSTNWISIVMLKNFTNLHYENISDYFSCHYYISLSASQQAFDVKSSRKKNYNAFIYFWSISNLWGIEQFSCMVIINYWTTARKKTKMIRVIHLTQAKHFKRITPFRAWLSHEQSFRNQIDRLRY